MKAGFSDQTDQEFLDSMVASINEYRAKHGAPPVALDPKIVNYAKSRAEHVADMGKLVHDGTQEAYGENLSKASSSGPTLGLATDATGRWYGENQYYNYETSAPNDPSKAIGHFTQLVWKDCTKIGAGRVCGKNADSEWHDTYIVVNFFPRGNMEGAYKDNVLPPK